jgi:hypothetical protein
MSIPEDLDIVNAKDGNSQAIGRTLYTDESTADYKTAEGTLTTDTVFDVYSQLGRYASAGYIVNDDPVNSVGIQFSVDGTNFGDTITLNAAEIFDFNVWFAFKTIKLIHTNNIDYRMVVR